jgi:putative membrane protein
MSPASRFRLHILLPFMTSFLALGACSSAQPPAPPLPSLKTTVVLTPGDIAFAQKFSTMNIVQSATAKSAETHAGRSDFAILGTAIAQDATSQQTALATLVAPHAIALPTTAPKEDQILIKRLKALHGPAFDRLYIRYLAREITLMKLVLDAEILASSNTDLVKLAKSTNAKLSAYQEQIQ